MLGAVKWSRVFQVESAGMRKALVEMRADRFEDLIALGRAVSARPDGQYPDLLRGKLGEEQPDYIASHYWSRF